MSGRLANDLPPGAELGAAQNIAAADNDGQLHAALNYALCLAGDVQGLVDADAALVGVAEAFATELEDNAFVFRSQRISSELIFHSLLRGALGVGHAGNYSGAKSGSQGKRAMPSTASWMAAADSSCTYRLARCCKTVLAAKPLL